MAMAIMMALPIAMAMAIDGVGDGDGDGDGDDRGGCDGEAETRICMSLADLSTGTMTDIYEPASPVSSSEWEQLGAAALAISSVEACVTISRSISSLIRMISWIASRPR